MDSDSRPYTLLSMENSRPYTSLFDLIMHTKKLDALDVVAFGSCCRELREASAAFWKGLASRPWPPEPASSFASSSCWQRSARRVLRTVEKTVKRHADENKTSFMTYVSLSKADDCILCGTFTTRRDPLRNGVACCCRCASLAESAASPWAPLAGFRVITEQQARRRFCLSGRIQLAKHLPYFERIADMATIVEVARRFARPAPRPPGVVKNKVAPWRAEKPEKITTVRVFSHRAVVCLLLEKFGGPTLLYERMCQLTRPPPPPPPRELECSK